MLRVAVACVLIGATGAPALADSFATSFPWNSPSYRRPAAAQPSRVGVLDPVDATRRAERQPTTRRREPGPKVLDGGGQPAIAPIAPKPTTFTSNHEPGTVVIDSSSRKLYLVQSRSTALVYPVSVGREGFAWTGSERISRVAAWPDWRPPAEMREREPHLPELMTGGVRNPLGAKALYLGSTLYRIHGTNSVRSIGQASSSGCFRMLNGHVIDLASRVGVGTRVVVVSSLPSNVARAR